VLTTLLFSCEKHEDQKVAYGDVIFRSFNRGDSIVYGVCYYAYSYDKMKEVSVTKEGTTVETILDSTEYRFTFSYLPDSSVYSSAKPVKGTYTFNAVFDDDSQYETYDVLDSVAITPPIIKECDFNTEDQRFNIDWETVTYADQYRVILENEKKEIVYQSDFLYASQSYISISTTSNGWLTDMQPDGGEKYRAMIVAYQYEANASAFDLQSISFTKGEYFQWLLSND
jgi:hypothetical protein